ncbi:MAG: flavin reductase family protein [Gemmatimonadales bacterium]|jgi:flavin reductase (DIM6/NTAB) family NADH-FMN oxidoreductase RutF
MSDSIIDPATFRSVLGRFASGVTVVTIRDAQGADHGMTVSAFCSLSLLPPLVLICVEKGASMYDALAQSTRFVVNVLEASQEELARRFAEEHPDRFDGIGFTRGLNGAAIIDDCLAVIECDVLARHPGGDHTIVLGTVIGAATREGRPLLYYRGGYAMLER